MKTLLPAALIAAASLWGGEALDPRPFVTADQLSMAALLPSPPAAGSERMKAEIAELHRLQETRTLADIEHARKDDAQEDIFVFRDAIGTAFVRENLPITAKLSDLVHKNEAVVVNPAKRFFERPRPYAFDASIHPVCKIKTNPADYAYPGGHATSGYIEALVLTLIVPEKRDAILARADDYAHSRLVCGVHYPGDLEASRSVAYAMIAVMLNNPDFNQLLQAAKTETRRELKID